MNLVVHINLAPQLYSQIGLWRNPSILNDKYTLHPERGEGEREDEELWSVSETVLVKQYRDMLRQDVYTCSLF